jgi:glyoxylate reductase
MLNEKLPLVLITHTLPADWLAPLQGRCRPVIGPMDATYLAPELEALLPQAEGLLTLLTISVNASLLERAPKLRVVSNMAVGVDNIDVRACTQRGIPVGNTPGVLTESTADLTMAILLAVARRIPQASQDARQGRWKTWSPAGWLGKDLTGATMGIIGMGKIGQAVAQRALGFGMKIVYADANPNPNAEKSLAAVRMTVDELLRQCDIVSLHVPLTEQTRHLINEDALRLMKRDAILVNTSRGAVVDTEALVKALREGWIAAAALDVTDPEPLPPEHPLYALPNCLIVPHIGSATWNTRKRMAELACENLLAGLEGRRLPHCVNPEVYERL